MVRSIAVGSDHAGIDLKLAVKEHLRSRGIDVIDKGTHVRESVDYPDFAHAVADAVAQGEVDLGVLICGSGNGVAMAANRHKGVRAAVAWAPELGNLARTHNDANVLALPARFIAADEALSTLDAYLDAAFEGGRHKLRVEKIELP